MVSLMAEFEPLEVEARAFHEARAWDAQAIFLDGLNLLALGFLPLEGHVLAEFPEQRVMATLLGQDLASMRGAFDLACRGYYLQALTLVRATLDDWVAYWYLRNNPGDHWRFVTADYEPPPLQAMVELLDVGADAELLPDEGVGDRAVLPRRTPRESLERLEPLRRYSRAWAQGPLQSVPTFDVDHLGPRRDEAFFRGTIAEMVEILALHLEALDDFRRLAVEAPIGELDGFLERVRAWQTRQVAILNQLGKG